MGKCLFGHLPICPPAHLPICAHAQLLIEPENSMIDIDAIIDSMGWSLDADERKDMRRLCQATLKAAAEQSGEVVGYMRPRHMERLRHEDDRQAPRWAQIYGLPFEDFATPVYRQPQPMPQCRKNGDICLKNSRCTRRRAFAHLQLCRVSQCERLACSPPRRQLVRNPYRFRPCQKASLRVQPEAGC